MIWFLVGCRAPVTIEADYQPSEFVPDAGRVRWDGPAGHATLWADPGWLGGARVVSEADVTDGESSLPLALIPSGTWKWWVVVVAGDHEYRSASEDLELPDAPAGAGSPHLHDVNQDQSQLAQGGYWIGYHYGYKDTPEDAIPMIVDGDGEIVWWLPADTEGFRAMRIKPSADGRAVLILQDHFDGSKRRLFRYALDGSARGETWMPDASHDFWENDDGTFTYVSYVFSDTELMPGHPGPVAADHLRTIPEGATDLSAAEEGFDFFEDYPQDPWWTCSHANYNVFVPDASEWSHVNSILKWPDGDGWLIQSRFMDAAMLVDGHQRKWQAGGLFSTLTPTSDAAIYQHGHSSDAWLDPDDGLVHHLVFDNGDHSPQPIVSRVVELAYDPDAGTYSEVWDLPDPEGQFTGFLGDARRLPNGDTLVVWTARGEVVEYTPDGRDVWRLDADGSMGRGFWVPSLDLGGR
jgi:hypothetical protein